MAKSYTAIAARAVTALNSLASAAYYVSDNVNNNAALAFEIEMFITLLTTTTLGVTGSFDIYIVGSTDGGTNYEGGITNESNATYTPTGDDVSEFTRIGSLTYTAETAARTLNKRFLISDVPKDFKVVIFNKSGTALGATTCAVEMNAIKYT